MTMDLCGLKKTYNIYLLKFLWSGRGLAAEWFPCWSHPGSLQSVGTSAGPVGFTHRPQVSSLLIRTPGSSPMWPLWQLDWTFSCHGGANSVCVTSPISIGQSKSHIHDQIQEVEKQTLLLNGNSSNVTLQGVWVRDRKILLSSLHSTTPLPSKSSQKYLGYFTYFLNVQIQMIGCRVSVKTQPGF